MYLFEQMQYLNKSPKALAIGFARYLTQDCDADRADISRELAAILAERERQNFELELLSMEDGNPWEDFADIPPEDGNATASEAAANPTDTAEASEASEARRVYEEARQAERAEARAEIEAKISALDKLFKYICKALNISKHYLTGGEISALKRAGVPPELAAHLDTIKREHRNSLPEAERLTAEDAEALYNGLTRAGFIKGTLTDFKGFMGKLSTQEYTSRNSPISWLNTHALFAFFAWRFTKYTQAPGGGYLIRQKALCKAFDIKEKRWQNVIAPYLNDFRSGRSGCNGSAEIEKIFAALPGNNKPKND